MSADFDTTYIPYIIIAILTGIAGYFTRRFEKLEEHRDEIHLKILPAISHQANSFGQSAMIYIKLGNFNEFKIRLDSIVTTFGEQISSGDIILARIRIDRFQEFYWGLVSLKAIMDELDRLDQRKKADWQREFRQAFSSGNKDISWLELNPKQLIADADEIRKEADAKIDSYKSISWILIIIIVVIAIIVGVANYLTAAIESDNGSEEQDNGNSTDAQAISFLNPSNGHYYYEAVSGDRLV